MLLHHSYQTTFSLDEKSPYIFTASAELISVVIIGRFNVSQVWGEINSIENSNSFIQIQVSLYFVGLFELQPILQKKKKNLYIVLFLRVTMDTASHSLVLLQQLNMQREFGFLCDCTVAIGDVYFKAHRAVLAAFSNYFKMIFIHQTR